MYILIFTFTYVFTYIHLHTKNEFVNICVYIYIYIYIHNIHAQIYTKYIYHVYTTPEAAHDKQPAPQFAH